MSSLSELMDLSDRVALVTGGAGHIGRTIVDVLAELGATTVVVDLDAATCDEVATDVADRRGTTVLAEPADLLADGDARRVVRTVVDRAGGLDILVHAAAFVGTDAVPGWSAPFEEQSEAAWRAALELNLTTAFVLAQEAAPALRRSGRGSVVNVSSIHGIVSPQPSMYEGTDMTSPAAYAASKGGIIQLTRWLAAWMAPDVRVNTLSPGGVLRRQPEAFVDRYAARTPLQRMATEDDLRGAVAYLASDLSAYVTGHNLVVDGGWTAW
jgi:NAD(P)-dependent dehydrogenase (short-subunit alcohol dehydrogenase family)